MDIYKDLEKTVSRCATSVKLGNVFVDTDKLDSENEYKEQLAWFNHFNAYTNWYIPFQTCTHYIPSKVDHRGTTSSILVTFNDTKDHKITSPVDFTITISELGTLKGSLELKLKSEYTEEDHQEHQKNNPEYTFIRSEMAYSTSTEEAMFVIVFTLKTFHYRDPIARTNCIERLNFKLTKPAVLMMVARSFINHIVYSYVYFTRLLVNTKLFVVEERSASTNKKGVIKSDKNKLPLFRVIDVKTLRKHYIKRNDNDNGDTVKGTKAPHERRRHERTFRSDFYKNRKGETIIIEPVWVGPIESYDPEKKRLYKVRLDIG